MHPVLFTLPLPGRDFEVSTYRAAYTVGALAAVWITWLLASRTGMPRRRVAAVIAASAFALPVGARVWHIITNPSIYAEEPARILSLSATGHALFGGVLGLAAVGFVTARLLRLDPWRLADAGAVGLAGGLAIMRVGCFANGCCFGLPTTLPWGVQYGGGSYAHLWQMLHGYVKLFQGPLAVHPTQLYELAGALACGGVALLLLRRGATPGVPFLTFVGLFAIVRAANWVVRIHPDTITDPGIYWWIYGATVVACAGLVAWRVRVETPT